MFLDKHCRVAHFSAQYISLRNAGGTIFRVSFLAKKACPERSRMWGLCVRMELERSHGGRGWILIGKSSQSLIRSGPTSAWAYERKLLQLSKKGQRQRRRTGLSDRQGQGWPDTARAGSPEHFPFSAGIGSFRRDGKSFYAETAAAACHTGLAGMGWRGPRVRPVFRGDSRRYFFLMASARASAR